MLSDGNHLGDLDFVTKVIDSAGEFKRSMALETRMDPLVRYSYYYTGLYIKYLPVCLA
jgi:hypothetical protein